LHLAKLDVTSAVCQLLEQRRHQYLPTLGLAGDAGCKDHVPAEEVLHLLDQLPGMQADAHQDRLLSVLLIVGGKGPLDGHGAL